MKKNWVVASGLDIFHLSKERCSAGNQPSDFPCVELDCLSQGTGEIISTINISKVKGVRNRFWKGQVLYGKLRPYLDKYARPGFDGACSTEIWVIDTKDKTKLLQEYLFCLVQSTQFRSAACTMAGTKMPRASWEIIKSANFDLPPLAEQEQIAEIFLVCDVAIEKANALAFAKKRQYGLLRKKLIETCEGKELGLDQMESMGLIELGRGDIISKDDMGKAPGSYPIYSSSVKNNGVFGKYGKYMFDQELITWSVDGGGHFFHRPKHKFSVTNVCGYMKVDEGKINYFFLAACLQELHRKLTFDYQLKAHPSVIRKVYRVKIPLLAEQEKIAKTLADAKKEIDLLKNLAEKYRAQKRGLMQQLLTGKIRVLPKNNKGGTK